MPGSSGWSASEHNRQSGQRQRVVLAALAVVVVLLVVGGLVLAKSLSGSGSTKRASGGASSSAITAATTVPAATLDKVGAGAYTYVKGQSGLQPVQGTPISAGSRPTVVYVGAEYCPYCAAQRWPLVVALSRFGKFSGLQTTTSSSSDVHADTPTFTFLEANYTSSYIGFSPVELQDRQGKSLQQPSALQQKLVGTYDRPPYQPNAQGQPIPFIYLAGKYVSIGVSYNQDALDGKSIGDIAAALKDPGSAVGERINGAANALTAGICAATGDKPATVCSASGVRAAAARVPGAAKQ